MGISQIKAEMFFLLICVSSEGAVKRTRTAPFAWERSETTQKAKSRFYVSPFCKLSVQEPLLKDRVAVGRGQGTDGRHRRSVSYAHGDRGWKLLKRRELTYFFFVAGKEGDGDSGGHTPIWTEVDIRGLSRGVTANFSLQACASMSPKWWGWPRWGA